MGYNLYATCGTPGRRLKTFDLKNRPWGDEWETSLAIKIAAKHLGIRLGGSLTGGAAISALKAGSKITLGRLIGDALSMIYTDAKEVEIRIGLNEDNTFWFDRDEGKTFLFNRQMASSSVVDMLKFLGAANLNRMGPLEDISMCLSEWNGKAVKGRHHVIFQFSSQNLI